MLLRLFLAFSVWATAKAVELPKLSPLEQWIGPQPVKTVLRDLLDYRSGDLRSPVTLEIGAGNAPICSNCIYLDAYAKRSSLSPMIFADALDIPMRAGSVDVVLANYFYNSSGGVEWQRALINEVFRILKPGGVFVSQSSIPLYPHEIEPGFDHADLRPLAERVAFEGASSTHPYAHQDELERLAREMGYSVVHTRPVEGGHYRPSFYNETLRRLEAGEPIAFLATKGIAMFKEPRFVKARLAKQTNLQKINCASFVVP